MEFCFPKWSDKDEREGERWEKRDLNPNPPSPKWISAIHFHFTCVGETKMLGANTYEFSFLILHCVNYREEVWGRVLCLWMSINMWDEVAGTYSECRHKYRGGLALRTSRKFCGKSADRSDRKLFLWKVDIAGGLVLFTVCTEAVAVVSTSDGFHACQRSPKITVAWYFSDNHHVKGDRTCSWCCGQWNNCRRWQNSHRLELVQSSLSKTHARESLVGVVLKSAT